MKKVPNAQQAVCCNAGCLPAESPVGLSSLHARTSSCEPRTTASHQTVVRHLRKIVLKLSEYASFITDYLDYSDTCYNLNIFINEFNEFEIFVSRDNFLNTLSCIEIFIDMNLEEIT